MLYKRYCKTLLLKHNDELIEAYKNTHAIGAVWPEIRQGMKEVGILDMEIYIHGNELATKPRQGEWEAYVSRFQETSAEASAEQKWQLMDRIFELDQKKEYPAQQGQLKSINA